MDHLARESAQRTALCWACRAALLLLSGMCFALAAGCNPASLAMMLMPFLDDKEPARCKLSVPNKETTVAIVTWFGNRELMLYSELMPADNEISERLAANLRDRFKLNKEKVKIVPNTQVRVLQSRLMSGTWSPADLGKKVKADFVVALEINALALHEKGSYQQMYRGSTEIAVKAYDLSQPDGEQVVFSDFYRREFPKENAIDATGSVQQFRATFLNRVARDLSRWFAGYANDERMHDMETD